MHYTLQLSEKELESLEYIADRYAYADVLVSSLEETDEPGLFTISESDMFEFYTAVEEEDGHLPLLGGKLKGKIEALLDKVV